MAVLTGRRRPGRFFEIGPLEFETRQTPGGYASFDPIGTQDLTGCTYKSDAEIEAMEERDEPGWWKTKNWLTLDSAPPRLGGNFEFNFGRYQVGVTAYWRWCHWLAMRLNLILSAHEERKYLAQARS